MTHPHSPNGSTSKTFNLPTPTVGDAKRQASLARRIMMFPLDLFSSVWLGITLLTLLFLYSSIGSAGIPTGLNILSPSGWGEAGIVRQWRSVELTEFEWFHWWPFTLLIGLMCLNIITATLRRIPLNAVNVGVWMIHSGILILAAGSVWYFSVKVEGEAPICRRLLTIHAPGSEPTTLPVIPGNRIVLGRGQDQYALTISSIDPQWEIRSGDDAGKTAYSVNVEVQSAAGLFIRQLLAGYPQYTEDVIRNPNPTPENSQPMVRAIKALGKPLVDEALELSLAFDPQPWFYLMHSRAVYLRELNADGTPKTDWIERPIGKDLPRYNDYIASADDVWTAPGRDAPKPDPLDIAVPAVDPNDPLPTTTLHISRFLRHAQLETRRRIVPNAPLDPVVRLRVSSPRARSESYELAAADPQRRTASNGKIAFLWIRSTDQLDALRQIIPPVLKFSVPGTSISVEKQIRQVVSQNPDLPFEPIEGTDYSYRVQGAQDSLNINNRVVSVAIVEIKSPQKSYTRWVFDDSKMNRDLAKTSPGSMAQHEADIPLDTGLETTYIPGHLPPAPVMIVGGPGENDLTTVISLTTEQKVQPNIKPGDVIPIAEGVTLTIEDYASHTLEQTRPAITPDEQRDRKTDFYQMIRIDVPVEGEKLGEWLPFNLYAFEGPDDVLRRFPYRPVRMAMPDGRMIEMMFARQRLKLPAPVALDEFRVASHIGGFDQVAGRTSTVMDWTSMICFNTDDGWSAPAQVSVNKPAEYKGYWYFQAQWDPPEPPRSQGDPGTRGLNYTVLGVGNREGVHVQLVGCCIAVLGMIYTFYVRPVIKRRRQQQVYDAVAAARIENQTAREESLEAVMLKEDRA